MRAEPTRNVRNWHSTTGRLRSNGRGKSGGDLTLFPLGSSTGGFRVQLLRRRRYSLTSKDDPNRTQCQLAN